MSSRYTADGKRKSSMTHANRSWTCDCGRKVWGNGGKSSHQRACRTWAEAQVARLDRLLADYMDVPHLTEGMRRWAAERDQLRWRLADQSRDPAGQESRE